VQFRGLHGALQGVLGVRFFGPRFGGRLFRSLVFLGAIVGALLISSASAMADGPCGPDRDGPTACGITSPASENGSLVTSNEQDYYVFYAQNNTELSVSMTDTENPICSTEESANGCGSAGAELYDSQGDDLDEGANSNPENGVTVPGTFDYTLGAGTYYLIVNGSLGEDQYGNPTAVPYTLSVSGSPAVLWPKPAPPTPTPTPTPTPKPASAQLRVSSVSASRRHGVTIHGTTATSLIGNIYVYASCWQAKNYVIVPDKGGRFVGHVTLPRLCTKRHAKNVYAGALWGGSNGFLAQKVGGLFRIRR
jgi:hypothetical protein